MNKEESTEKTSLNDSEDSRTKNVPVFPVHKQGRNLHIQLKQGFAWNPLLTLPRNIPCPCRSGKKFKACHLNMLPRVIPEKFAKRYREQMRAKDLVFLTKENEKEIAGEVGQEIADSGLNK